MGDYGRRSRRAVLAAAVALASAVATGPADAAPLRPQPCEQVAASPAFASDRTVFCGGTVLTDFSPTGVALFVSADAGRSWKKATALGLPYKAGDRFAGLAVSPRFATDKTVFVSVWGEGVFVSADAGETFLPLIPGGVPHLTAFTGGAGPETTQRTMVVVAQWLGGKPALVDPVAHTIQPVTGAPLPATEMLVSPAWLTDRTAFAVTEEGDVGARRVSLFPCTATFDCAQRRTSFPAGYVFRSATFAADFAKSRTLFVHLVSDAGTKPGRLYVSRDAGKTFVPMTATESLVKAHTHDPRVSGHPVVALAAGRPGSRRLWLRVYGSADAAAPTAALYRSDDNGRSWSRVAYGRIAQRGPHGTMPDLRVPQASPPRLLLAATADDHVFHNGITKGGWDVSCSADAGRTWRPSCR